MALDPQVKAYYGDTKFVSCFGEKDIDELRILGDEKYISQPRLTELPLIEDGSVAGRGGNIPVRIYHPVLPGSQKLPVMMYFHGGGYTLHNIETHDNLCRKLSDFCNTIVVSVDYRLAPENRHPAQIEDAVDVLCWVYEHAESFGGDRHCLITAGDSAGAGISACLSLYSHYNSLPAIALQVLYYGTYGSLVVEESESYRLYSDGNYVLPADALRDFSDFVTPKIRLENNDVHDLRSDMYLQAGLADPVKLSVKSLFVSAECDPLRDDGMTYAQVLKDNGCDVTSMCMSGFMHGFIMNWDKFDRLAEVFEATKKAIEDIKTK